MDSRTAVRSSGFTLIELLIVISVISIVASIAVPHLVSGRLVANEKSAVATIRTVVSAQAQFQLQGAVDQNQDGLGEYGFLGELSGTMPPRGSVVVLSPSPLGQGLGIVDASGTASRKGYLFRVYLPDPAGVGLAEAAGNLLLVDPDLAASYWTVMAWPAAYGRTGTQTFFSSQQGEILFTTDPRYSGRAAPILPSAPFIGAAPGVITGGDLAVNALGSDGNYWRLVQ